MKKLLSCLPAVVIILMLTAGISFSAESTLYLGPADALKTITDQITALSPSDFDNPSQAISQKKDLIRMLNESISKAENGNYRSASNLLSKKISSNVKKWIISEKQSKILESINNSVISISNASQTTVSTSSGKLAGVEGTSDCWTWIGIPYAKPPVGELRWKAPQDPDRWNNIRFSTDKFSPCTQPVTKVDWRPLNQVKGSEDCLYLNVFRPKTNAKNLPVYFWIHGGSNIQGGANDFLWASTLANKSNMVVVVIQYRLGPFGWFYHPALNSDGTREEQSGNFGQLDIIKALNWVHRNIDSFGGNRNNITVAGESAGAFNILNLMTSPLAKGLFHKAIVESAGGVDVPVSAGVQSANAAIDKLLVRDGTCPDLAAAAVHRASMSNEQIKEYLKNKPADDLVHIVMGDDGTVLGNISPFVDGYVIPDTISSAFESGKYNHVPIIIGNNEYEIKPFLPLIFGAIPTSSGHTWSEIYDAIETSPQAISLDQLMPLDSDREFYEACGKYPSMYWKAAMVDSLARSLRKHQDNVYCYLFKWGGKGSGPKPFDTLMGAAHSFELPFFFGWNKDLWNCSYTDENKSGRNALQEAIMSYTASFAASGNPNRKHTGLPVWEKWSNSSNGPKSINLDADLTNAKIFMTTEELTKDGVRSQVNSLPEPLKSITQALMWF